MSMEQKSCISDARIVLHIFAAALAKGNLVRQKTFHTTQQSGHYNMILGRSRRFCLWVLFLDAVLRQDLSQKYPA